MPQNERKLLKFADLLRENASELGMLETKATGSAVMLQSIGYGVCADLFTYYARLADKIHGDSA
jgi:acyl-CoA reductase-like NAD-dependent aldehyde dehydrogenase